MIVQRNKEIWNYDAQKENNWKENLWDETGGNFWQFYYCDVNALYWTD